MGNPPDTRLLEECALNAWPAHCTVHCDGWVLRLSGGLTKRANSANPLAPAGDFAAVRQQAEALYARHRLPTIFRVTPLAPAGVDAALEDAGYAAAGHSLVLVGPPISGDHQAADVRTSAVPTAQWCAGYAEAAGIDPGKRPALDSLVAGIALPAAFATATLDGRPVGYGMAVAERRMVGLFGLVVAEAARGHGVGRSLASALLRWGEAAQGSVAYLQVEADNASARSIYARLGFREAYRYHYRISGEA